MPAKVISACLRPIDTPDRIYQAAYLAALLKLPFFQTTALVPIRLP